jgi:glutathione synthase/RimK-type ligase-like ATP-grasp enzyme
MKIAIHHRSGGFTDKWIEYCEAHKIEYKVVNCYDSDIIQQLDDFDGLLWHWQHNDYKAIHFARQLTYSIEKVGKMVFPNSSTCWHFDDKVGQKYLLEALKEPLVKSYVFYDKKEAFTWAKKTNYPKVFKLRGGAGSINVKLVLNQKKAILLIKKAFGNGFSPNNNKEKVQDRWGKLKRNKNKNSFFALIRGLALYFLPQLDINYRNRSFEKGYIYFQEFISDNDCDIRVIVIGERAFAIKRMVRKNDFKASGSGVIKHDKEEIPLECIKEAYRLSEKLETQCQAIDFVFDKGVPKIVEISYGFSSQGYFSCKGFWDKELNWHEGSFIPEWFIIEDFVSQIIISKK